MKHLITLALALCVAATLHPAYAADIKPALIHTFGNEGGFQNDPGDSGNYAGGKLVGTKYGIAAASYPHEDIPNLTLERAGQIYQRDFWGASRCDEWPNQIVANLYFDFAVNMGQGTAARIIQRAINYAGLHKGLKPIPIDGNIGPGTIARMKQVDQTLLFVHLVGLGHGRYVQIVDANPKKAQYLDDWAIRIKKNVQRSVHEYEALRAR